MIKNNFFFLFQVVVVVAVKISFVVFLTVICVFLFIFLEVKKSKKKITNYVQKLNTKLKKKVIFSWEIWNTKNNLFVNLLRYSNDEIVFKRYDWKRGMSYQVELRLFENMRLWFELFKNFKKIKINMGMHGKGMEAEK